MIVYLPAALFVGGLLLAYGSAGRARQAGTIVTVLATGWSLALLVDPGSLLWAIGPLAAAVLLTRPAQRASSSFEGLTRRVVTVVVALLVALILASRLPVGENPLLLNAVPWFLAALGAAWLTSPIDQRERLQGQVLMVSAAAAVIMASVPAGVVTATLAGLAGLLPVGGQRWRVPGRLQLPLRVTFLALAGLALAMAATGPAIAHLAVFDLSLDVSGIILLGAAVLLVAAAALIPAGFEWLAPAGMLAVSASAPSLRWAALGALIALATLLTSKGEQPAWLAFGVLVVTPVVSLATAAAAGSRVQAVALALGLVLMVVAARAGLLRVLVLPATGLLVMIELAGVSGPNLVRAQWVLALGAAVLVARPLLDWLIDRAERSAIVRDQLLCALFLLAVGARDALGLGMLAAALLLIDLAIVRVEVIGGRRSAAAARLVLLARSNWPPAVTFAAASLAVIAALQASLALGLLAALLLALLQAAPLLDGRAPAPSGERARPALGWVAPAISIACGIAPALVLRMLRP